MSEANEHKLKIGERAKVRPGAFRAQVSIVYSGMINESTFSIAVIWSFGHNSLAYNLYLPKYQRQFLIPKGRVEILNISNEEIQFKHYAE